MKTLVILTSHDSLGNTGEKTGFWLEEFAAPYYVLKDAGADITLATPLGGQPPLDPKSDAKDFETDATRRFKNDTEAQALLANTQQLHLVDYRDFDAVFYPGGHGPLWDLAENEISQQLLEYFDEAKRPIAAVCHAPGIFRHTRGGDARPLVAGRKVTGFTNTEEAAVGLTDVVPFLVEDMLEAHSAHYSKGPDWAPYVVTDGNLITGQNPASSEGVAKALLAQLSARKAA